MGLLVCVTVGALVVGLLTRGTFEQLASLPLRGWPTVAIATIALLVGALVSTAAFVAGVAVAGLCMLFILGRNRRVEGVPLIAAGLLLNVVVITANGAMPVSLYAEARAGLHDDSLLRADNGVHEIADADTRLSALGDVVPVPLPLRPETVSAGDVLIVSGVALLIVAGMHRRETD